MILIKNRSDEKKFSVMLVFNILTNFCYIFSNNKVSQAKRTARETIFYKKLKNFYFFIENT